MCHAVHLGVDSEADIHPLSRKLGTRAGSGEEKLLLLAEQPPAAPVSVIYILGSIGGPRVPGST